MIAKRLTLFSPPEDGDVDVLDVGPSPPRPSVRKKATKGWLILFVFVCLLVSRSEAAAPEVEATAGLSAGQRRLSAKDEFSHFWDFRGCITGEAVVDSIEGSSLAAKSINGTVCGVDGISLDGNDDYVDIDDWTWGGTTSIEVYVKYNSFNKDSAILHFGGGTYEDNVILCNYDTESQILGWVAKGATHQSIRGSNFDSSTWTHVVLTVSDTTYKMYKNGVHARTITDGFEPNVLIRPNNWLGRDAWALNRVDGYMDGTIAYVKIWHGVELQQSDVTELYAPHNTAHHFWDFRGCTTGEVISDSIVGDLVATPMNGPTCVSDGISMDGNDDYVNIDDWEWGGTTSFEVYVKYNTFNSYSSIFDCGDFYLLNHGNTSKVGFSVHQESSNVYLKTSNWDSHTWTHVVITVSGTTMKIYKNGALVGTQTDGWEPLVRKRTQHWLGRPTYPSDENFHGTISYAQIWHGVELKHSDVADLYAPHNIAHHFWDFRGCATGGTVTDSVAGDLVATPMNGPVCGPQGISMDGTDDFVDIDDWEWGGAMSVEAYVKYNSFNFYSRVFDFSNGERQDNVILGNQELSSTIAWDVFDDNTYTGFQASYFESSAWTHVVVTVSGTTLKIYKNKILVGTSEEGQEPTVLTRTKHWLGKSPWSTDTTTFDGTLAYVRIWHGVELQESDVAELYAPHHVSHFWDFRSCSGSYAVDNVEGGSLKATYHGGASCGMEGISLDGNDDYVDIDNWEWGGTTSIEVYIKYDSFKKWSRVFSSSNGQSSDNVMITNYEDASTIYCNVVVGEIHHGISVSNFDSSTWTHVVFTVSGTTMKVYKNGALAGTKTDGDEPSFLKRNHHWLGQSAWSTDGYFDGTIAYLKMWHGVELQQSDVTKLYAPHNTAHHFWDFRACTTGVSVIDSISGELTANPTNGPTCGPDGINFDGNDDYADIMDWGWGSTTSFEVYLMYDSFNYYSSAFDFSNGAESDNVVLANYHTTSTIKCSVYQGSTAKYLRTSNFDSSTWTHVVVTVSATNMKIYKNGVLVGTNTDGHEPNVLTRTQHWLGRSAWLDDGYFDGTIAYVKMWHGVELQHSDVKELYAPHNTAHHFWDFRGCTTGGTVMDSIAGDLVATPMNGPVCLPDGLRLDGSDDYADIGDWEWGGTTSIEVYVKYDSFNYYSMVFNFGNGYNSDNVYLRNDVMESTIHWSVRQGSTYKGLYTSNFDYSAWTHVVVTVSGTTMKVYKNGDLVETKTDGLEPNILTRTDHIIGNRAENDRAFDGTIAYVKMWHGVELQQSDVPELFTGRDTTPCPPGVSSGSNCATCEAGKYGSSYKNKPACVLCPAGRYSDTTQSTSFDTCLTCGAGKASSSKGATSESTCTTCDAGKYTNSDEASLCVDCIAGKSSTDVGARNETVCSICGAGSYQDNAGSTSCVVCPAGTYNADRAVSAEAHNSQQTCSHCYPGTFLCDEGTDATKHDESDDCQECPPGTYTNDDEGENECHACPAGKTSAARASACGVCPSGYQCSEDGGTIPCAPGTYSNNDALLCSPCPPGHYCPGATDKQLCLVGTSQPDESQAECFACPGGKHQYSRGSTVCNGCPPGHFCPERTVNPYECGSEALYCPANSSTVEVIQKGWYTVKDDGSSKSTRQDEQFCELGYACVGGGKSQCKGNEHSSEDRTSCKTCDKFKEFNNVTMKCECKETFKTEEDFTEEDGFRCTCPVGQTLVDGKCTDCEDGWFKSTTGIQSCTSCDAEVIEDAFKTHPSVTTKDSKETCACGVGTFRDHHPNSRNKRLWKCQDCEDPDIGLNSENVECKKPGLTLETLPVNNGFWRSSANSNKIEECDMKEACSQRPGTNGTGCREGHEGPICAVCKDGFSKNTLKGICRPCDKLETLLYFYIGGPILLIVTLIGPYYFFRKKYGITGGRRDSINAAIAGFNKASADKNHWVSHIRTRGKILFSFYQIVSSLPETLSIVFPKMYTKFINIVSVISKLNFFEMINMECFLQKTQILPKGVYDYYGSFLATTLTPILISFALLGFTLYKRRKQNSVEAGRKLEATSFFLFFLLLYLVFTNTTQMAFSTLYCDTYSEDKTEYLVADRR
ncbi:hypothetical protein TL16_g05594 [Triparma laevis f. inornata]|uniref:Tyrosine-protein kinase ephrin type A/B receptor-like domain-containing protein n=1 Tax=Triparma laevis f. inornata TaxID=1714386 RepID=A0A9W7ANV6_9STRA|nr:hypothetical protein TL16_g05594 [Triparma laevis f. inornata]